MRGSVEADEESLDHIRDLAWSFDGAGVPRALDQLESGPGMPAATDLGTRPGGWARSISLWSGAAEWDPRGSHSASGSLLALSKLRLDCARAGATRIRTRAA